MKRITIQSNIALFLLLFLTTLKLEAQPFVSKELTQRLNESSIDSPLEEMFLQIDRGKYIAGEDVWFSIYTIDRGTGKLSSGSAVAYVELMNPWNIPLIQKRFQLSGGRGEGNFLLPDSISSGSYTILAYTNWMKNFLPYNCFTYDIDVYNPFKDADFWQKADSEGSPDKRLINSLNKSENRTHLRTDTIYGRREKVTIRIEKSDGDPDQSGITEMSVSVTPADVSASSRWINDFKVPGTYPKQYRFESDGHYLSGRVKYRESNASDSSDFLYLSVQGKVAEFKYAVIDTAGRFTFVLPLDSKLRNLILQPEHANNNMILEIEPSFSWILPESYSYKDTLIGSKPDAFSGLSFNYQASKIYGTKLKKESLTNDYKNLQKRRFYGIPEMEIFLDDYIRLPVMQEVFFELVPGVLLRSIKSGYDVKIVNPLTGNYYAEPPLVMIDGVIINDLTVLADLNPEIVEKIEVVKTPYLIGDLILHGIVNVITRSGDFSNITMPDYAVVLPYRVIDKPDTFIGPDYDDKQSSLNRIPDLRNTLYWNPSVKTNRNGNAEIEFWTSDLPGIYEINIQGISATGEKISLDKSFRVR
jgi:hypothetical protein